MLVLHVFTSQISNEKQRNTYFPIGRTKLEIHPHLSKTSDIPPAEETPQGTEQRRTHWCSHDDTLLLVSPELILLQIGQLHSVDSTSSLLSNGSHRRNGVHPILNEGNGHEHRGAG